MEALMRFVLATLAACYLCGAAWPGEDNWRPFTTKEGKFTVLWPGEPKVTRSKHPKTGTVKVRYEARDPGASIQLLFVDVANLPAAEVKRNGFGGTVKAVT